jgi:hypothetical protein
MNMTSRTVALAAALITLGGAVLRAYGLDWGAPYKHFHIDEHFVFLGAVEMRRDFWAAGESPKFFMYGPLPGYLFIGILEIYERVVRPLDLTGIRDGVTFTVLGRAVSAALGTATIPLVFLVARRLSGPIAGLLAALLLAFAPIHLRDSHFFTVDPSLAFFCTLTWWCALRMADRGTVASGIVAGLAFGAAALTKYTAAFLVIVIAAAHLLSPRQFAWPGTPRDWMRWTARGILPGLVAVGIFLLLDPLVIAHWEKFKQDVADQITEPHSGGSRPLWGAHFNGIQPQMYWFTNLLWWGVGPGLEIWGLAGVAWLLLRRTNLAWIGAVYPIAYYAVTGQSTLPFVRYLVPFVPGLAVAAGVLSADLLSRRNWRIPALAATVLVAGSTVLYGLAYMNIYRSEDARLQASLYLLRHVPRNASILVEPSHNIPPTGQYMTAPSFHDDYVLWAAPGDGGHRERHDYFRLLGLDTYRYLANPRVPDHEKRAYIDERLAQAEYILIDDTFQQFYAPLRYSQYAPVKDFYRDLFLGRLGFELVETWKVYPSLFGVEINDDQAELTFRLFDHPRVFLFKRRN